MIRILSYVSVFLATMLFPAMTFSIKAQDNTTDTLFTENAVNKDSLSTITFTADTALKASPIFAAMPSIEKGDSISVVINQSQAISDSLATRMSRATRGKKIKGYRIRIYSSNSQNARAESASAAGLFHATHPGHAVYHTFTSPYFKVTVGNFRTRSEALLLKNSVAGLFPMACIVREEIPVDF